MHFIILDVGSFNCSYGNFGCLKISGKECALRNLLMDQIPINKLIAFIFAD